MQLESGFLHPVRRFAGVDDEDDGIGGPGVRLPQRPDLFLTTDVPDEEGEVAWSSDEASNSFAVETDRGNGIDVLVKLEPEQMEKGKT